MRGIKALGPDLPAFPIERDFVASGFFLSELFGKEERAPLA